MRKVTSRRGSIVLLVCLSIVFLLCGVGLFIHNMSRQSYREFRRLDGFLRAVSVGEACYLDRLSELCEKPWSERPFKDSSESATGTWQDGSYEYLLVDGPGPFEADLLVKAKAEDSDVTLYWRFTADPFTFSPFRQIRTTYFSHESPDTALDVSAMGALRRKADQVMADRERNGDWSDGKIAAIGNTTNPNDIAAALGTPGGGQIPNQMAASRPGGTAVPLASRAPPPLTLAGLPRLELPARPTNPMGGAGGGGAAGNPLFGLFNGGGDGFDFLGMFSRFFPGMGAIASSFDTGNQVEGVSEGINATMQAADDVRAMTPQNPANAGRLQAIQAQLAQLESQAATYEQQLQSLMGGGMSAEQINARRSEVVALRQRTNQIAEQATRLRAEAAAL